MHVDIRHPTYTGNDTVHVTTHTLNRERPTTECTMRGNIETQREKS